MYDTITKMKATQKEPVGYVVVKLSPKEYQRLQAVTIGYGNLAAFARKVDLHVNTIRDILNRGTGKPETIKKLRSGL